MEITMLVDNESKKSNLNTQHGLSIHVQTKGLNILFDVGEDDLFLINAKKLGIDISQVDYVFISHGHYDHGGGIRNFLSNNKKAKVYIKENAFKKMYSLEKNNEYEDIGIDLSLKDDKRVVLVDDDFQISENLKLITGINNTKFPSPLNKALFYEEDGKYIEDDFAHEQNLLINENGEKVLITGCSHCGIYNILEQVKKKFGENIDFVVGGFHLFVEDCIYELENDFTYKLGEKLTEFNAEFYTCHCSGIEEYNKLKQVMREKIKYVSTGERITL